MRAPIHSLRIALVVIVGLLCMAAAAALPILVDRDSQLIEAEALYDPDGRLDISTVAASRDFAPRREVALPLLRPTRSVLWLRFSLLHAPGAQRDWWLAFSDTGLREAALYQSLDGAGFRRLATGIDRPFAMRPLPARQLLLPLSLDDGRPADFYLRIDSRDDFATELMLRTPEAMALAEHGQGLVYGLIYGAIAALALYNLFMMHSLREPLYLPYVLASFAALLSIAAFNGHTYQYLWPGWPGLALHETVLFPALWIVMFRRYARRLLELRRQLPLLDRCGSVLVGLTLASLALHLAGALQLGFWLGIACYGLTALYMLTAGFLRLRQGFKPAAYFLAGNLVLCVSVAIVITLVLGVRAAASTSAFFAMQVGVALQALLLSLALADRVRELRSDHENALQAAFDAQRELIVRLQRQEEELERRVIERTEALCDEIAARGRVEAQLRESEARLRSQALHDPLTGLANRTLLNDRLHHLIERQPRRRVPFALMLLDLDHFKPVNDRYGHEAGDRLLCEVAARLRSSVRAADTVARLGGDEFVLLAELLVPEDAEILAAKLVTAVSAGYRINGHPVDVGVSIGVACFPLDGAAPDDLLRHADAAMYHVKRSGRNGYAFWRQEPPVQHAA